MSSDRQQASPGRTPERIAQRAYELWTERGRPFGSPDLDWHAAEIRLAAEEQLEALHSVFGQHHTRAVHAKGVLLEGSFTPTAAARALSSAALFGGTRIPVTVRFSDFAGIPDVSDLDGLASPRGLALKFRLPDGAETDVVAHSFNGFPSATSDEFADLVHAIGASGPGASRPTALDAYLADHPIAAQFLTTQKGPPVTWATLAYFGANAFRFVDAGGNAVNVRYRFLPHAGEHLLDAPGRASKGPNYLREEIADRVAQGPVVFDWHAQIAAPGDVIDDPSVAWPEERKLVHLGTLSIVWLALDQTAAQRAISFMPGTLVPGIEIADPMIVVRDATYQLSVRERQAPASA